MIWEAFPDISNDLYNNNIDNDIANKIEAVPDIVNDLTIYSFNNFSVSIPLAFNLETIR